MSKNNLEKFLDWEYQMQKLLGLFDGFENEAREKALEALELAERAHRGQVRDEGGQYVLHPIRATLILLEDMGIKDIDIVCASLLHDVIEDTNVDIEIIKEQFGNKVAELVERVTRERPEDETEEQKVKSKQKKIRALAESDKETRLIKLCDRLDNRYSQEFIPENHSSQKKFERWNKEFRQYISIAKATNKKLYELFKEYEIECIDE